MDCLCIASSRGQKLNFATTNKRRGVNLRAVLALGTVWRKGLPRARVAMQIQHDRVGGPEGAVVPLPVLPLRLFPHLVWDCVPVWGEGGGEKVV